MHRWYFDAISNNICELSRLLSISFSQMHRLLCTKAKFTVVWKCKIYKVLKHPVKELLSAHMTSRRFPCPSVGVAGKHGIWGLLCTTSRCPQYLCQNYTRQKESFTLFIFDRCHGHQTNIRRPLLKPCLLNHTTRTSSQIRADTEMQETAWNTHS